MKNENPDIGCNKSVDDSNHTCTPHDSCSGSSFCMCSQHFPSIDPDNQVTHKSAYWTQQEDKKSYASIAAAPCVSPTKHVRQRRLSSCSFPKGPVSTKIIQQQKLLMASFTGYLWQICPKMLR